ncbi:single-stranded DNA-binding protein [Streptomyces luteolifulvus]|uniref:Single-stranded DNA-binding protein n=1 Tax=Streptomyces luteolifulvus TaxID=2615112 RepID=A0A6H9UT87_9ACTN|nr:single-stranded DNA-binding protein [Streptomyces luteolifulvus]KAB1141386.1 single-stranded DNA-binding protein [Streptomyces luteolifulvus]
MSGETTITMTGNVVADPELRFTPSGAAVTNFRMASTPRKFNRQTNEWEDGEPLFLGVAVWRQQAEHVAESIQRGMRVIVVGRLTQRQYEATDGSKRSSYEIRADEVAPSLLRATAVVTKANGNTQGAQQPAQSHGQQHEGYAQQPAGNPWATQRYNAEPPF